MFTWVDNAKITAFQVDWDASLSDYVLTLSGTNFGTGLTTSNTEVYADDIKQQVVSSSNTEIKVRILEVLSSTTSNIDIYLPSGSPDDSATTLMTLGITLPPRLLGVTPSIGSTGGSLIVADVRGLGVKSTGYTIVNAAGTDVCASKNVT
jgi:hypothetical protein